MRSFVGVGLAGVLLATTSPVGVAFAQKKGQPSAEEQEKAAKTAKAREHYDKGITHYNLGEFDKAIEEFKQAYAISGAPGLLFNVAQAYRLVGDYKQALYFYRTYLRLQPSAGNKADVEARIVEMEKALAEQKSIEEAKPKGTLPPEGDKTKPAETTPPPVETGPAETAPEPAAVAPPADPAEGRTSTRGDGKTKKIIGLATGGVGLALVGTGVYFAMQASSAASDIEDVSSSGGAWNPDLGQKYADGESAASTSMILLIAGGAAIAGGTVVYLLGMRDAADARDIAFVPAQGGGTLVFGGRF
jgi:tetratricopeptide (TPR) repeat protein